jgi:hypothetical protein
MLFVEVVTVRYANMTHVILERVSVAMYLFCRIVEVVGHNFGRNKGMHDVCRRFPRFIASSAELISRLG